MSSQQAGSLGKFIFTLKNHTFGWGEQSASADFCLRWVGSSSSSDRSHLHCFVTVLMTSCSPPRSIEEDWDLYRLSRSISAADSPGVTFSPVIKLKLNFSDFCGRNFRGAGHVWTTCPGSQLGNSATGSRNHDLLIATPAP